MFNQIVAIDVLNQVPDFIARAQAYAKKPALCFTTIDHAQHAGALTKDVDALVVSIYQPISEDSLYALPALRYLGVLGTSMKKLPLDLCKERHIMLTNVTHYCDEDTAEWVVLKILEHLRNQKSPQSAFHKTLGLIGAGAVSQQLINLALAFHMKIVFNSRHAQPELIARGLKPLPKEEIFASSDILSIHTPAFTPWLTNDIAHHARKDLCIINTCMGKISINDDLEQLLALRPDITVIMDKIAGDNYPTLKGRAQIHPEAAFETLDSHRRLVDKFFNNLRETAVKTVY